MTWSWTIPTEVKQIRCLHPPPITPAHTRAVIPTFRDWDGARATIESILDCHPRPADIVVVDDNEEAALPRWISRYPVVLQTYEGNRGPAFARNAGAWIRTGRRIDGLYFTDTGCVGGREFFNILAHNRDFIQPLPDRGGHPQPTD